MYTKMQFFTLGAMVGRFGASGLPAAQRASPLKSGSVRANDPMPLKHCPSISRRVLRGSVHIDKLVGVEQRPAERSQAFTTLRFQELRRFGYFVGVRSAG